MALTLCPDRMATTLRVKCMGLVLALGTRVRVGVRARVRFRV